MQKLSVLEIIELIGQDEADKLFKELGGVTFFFPNSNERPEHVTLTKESWAKLCKHYNFWVYIPKNEQAKMEKRNQKIRAMRAQGADIISLAIKFDLSDRRVRGIVGGVKFKKESG